MQTRPSSARRVALSPSAAADGDSRRACRLIGASTAVFFAGLVISAIAFYGGRPLDWTAAIISDLQSPEENPRGYLASAVATAITGGLFLRLLAIVHRRVRAWSAPLAWAGSAFFGAGAVGAIAIGCLAPFPHSYDAVHLPLAFATFIALVAGTGLHLLAAGWQAWPRNRRRGAKMFGCCVLIGGILAALAATYRIENYFTGDSLLTTLALWEWLLCASIVAFLRVLAGALARRGKRNEAGTPRPRA